jgi:hypothetical protein
MFALTTSKKIVIIILALLSIAFMDVRPTNADEAVHIPVTVSSAPSADSE